MTTICQLCSLPAKRASVVNGKYYSRLCDVDYNQLVRSQMPTSGQASYDRGRDVEDHMADIQQPWVGGKINPEWTRLWPDKAKEMFGEQAVVEAERKN